MTRKVIEDGNRRVILDRDEVVIEQNGETVAVKSPGADQVQHNEAANGHDDGVDSRYEAADVREARHTNRGSAALRGVMAIVVVAGVAVVGVLVARIALLAFEADASNAAVDAVYDITAPLIEPFKGIFEVQQLNGGGIFEPAAAIAAAIVLGVALVLVMAMQLASRRLARA
jgi:uncharacterized protein YggT (Ycf19 family)